MLVRLVQPECTMYDVRYAVRNRDTRQARALVECSGTDSSDCNSVDFRWYVCRCDRRVAVGYRAGGLVKGNAAARHGIGYCAGGIVLTGCAICLCSRPFDILDIGICSTKPASTDIFTPSIIFFSTMRRSSQSSFKNSEAITVFLYNYLTMTPAVTAVIIFIIAYSKTGTEACIRHICFKIISC